jgi:hypothetical protein
MKRLTTIDEFFDELMRLPPGALVFSLEEKHKLLEDSARDILNYYGVKSRQDVQ